MMKPPETIAHKRDDVQVIFIRMDGKWHVTITTPDGVTERSSYGAGRLMAWLAMWMIGRGLSMDVQITAYDRIPNPHLRCTCPSHWQGPHKSGCPGGER